jgi:putative DNA primase/helicase
MECVGIEGAGKSTFTNLVVALIGVKNCAITTLQTLEKNNFETASFYGKKLVLINDAPELAGDSGKLKALTGHDIWLNRLNDAKVI